MFIRLENIIFPKPNSRSWVKINGSRFCIDKCDARCRKKVFDTMIKWEEIQELYPLFGDYDLIAKIQASDYEGLSDIVVNKIRALKGVTETKTSQEQNSDFKRTWMQALILHRIYL